MLNSVVTPGHSITLMTLGLGHCSMWCNCTLLMLYYVTSLLTLGLVGVARKLQALVYDILQPLPYLVMP